MEKNPVVENLQRPFDWSGFYIGANIGGALSEYEFRGSGGDSDGHLFTDVDIGQQLGGQDLAGFDVVRFFDRIDKDRPDREELRGSILGGGQIGYQKQFGHFVIGVEGDFDRSSMRSIQKFQDFAPTVVLGPLVSGPGIPAITADTEFRGQREAQTNWVGSARGKFGYATGPLLFYGTAGVAFAQVDLWAHDVANSLFTISSVGGMQADGRRFPLAPEGSSVSFHVSNTDIDRDDDVMVGWTAGAGMELAFNDAVSLGLEYRHTGFGDQTFHFNSHSSFSGPIFPGGTNVNFDSDQVTVKLNVLLCHFFGHSGDYASATPATNNVAVKSPFGSDGDSVQVGYTKAKDADTWSAKDKDVAKVEEPFNWTGFYVGVNVGGAWTNYDFSGFNADVDAAEQFFDSLTSSAPLPDAPNAPAGGVALLGIAPFEIPGIDAGSDDSLIGGGQFGYQYQWHHFVFGVECDFSGLSSSKSTDYAATSSAVFSDKGTVVAIPTLTTTRKATTDWIATARAKFGYARGPLMLYVTGGGAWANVRTWASDQVVTDFFFPVNGGGVAPSAPSGVPGFAARSLNNTNDEDTIGGWTAGAGAEWAFSKIATLGVEYRHSEFDSADSHYDPHHSPIFANGYDVDVNTDQVTVKVNLLLGHMGPGH